MLLSPLPQLLDTPLSYLPAIRRPRRVSSCTSLVSTTKDRRGILRLIGSTRPSHLFCQRERVWEPSLCVSRRRRGVRRHPSARTGGGDLLWKRPVEPGEPAAQFMARGPGFLLPR